MLLTVSRIALETMVKSATPAKPPVIGVLCKCIANGISQPGYINSISLCYATP